MYPHQLIGKKALRTKEVKYSWGAIDRSYTSSPVTILAVTENHIVIESSGLFGNQPHILSYEWIDNNWTSYDDLMKLATPEHVAMMQSLQSGDGGDRLG